MIDPSVASAIVITLGGGLVQLLIQRAGRRSQAQTAELQKQATTRAQDTEDRKVDFEVLEASVDNLRYDLMQERGLRAGLARRVVQLEGVIRSNGMEVPPPEGPADPVDRT